MTGADAYAAYEAAMAEHLAATRTVMDHAVCDSNRYGDRLLGAEAWALNRAREILAEHQNRWTRYAERARAIHGAPDPGPDPSWALRTEGPSADFRTCMNGWRAQLNELRDLWRAHLGAL
jgi:hypothetical protein